MYDPLTIGIAGGAALLGGGLNLWGSGMQADAAAKGAQLQADASRYATDISNQQYKQNREDMQPYMQAGYGALGSLSNLSTNYQPMGVGGISPYQAYRQYTQPFSFDSSQDPSYRWRLQQGLDSLNASAAAKGGYFSGATGRALMDYGQGMASQEYQNAYNRDLTNKEFGLGAYGTAYGQLQSDQLNRFNQLASIANSGLGGISHVGNWGAQNAQQTGQNAINAALAQSEGYKGVADAWSGGFQNLNNQLMGGVGNLMQYKLLGLI